MGDTNSYYRILGRMKRFIDSLLDGESTSNFFPDRLTSIGIREQMEDTVISAVDKILRKDKHLIENNKENAMFQYNRYNISLYLSNKPYTSRRGYNINRIDISSDDSPGICDIRTITTIPYNTDRHYVLLSNERLKKRPSNAVFVIVDGNLYSTMQEILKIRDILGDYSVCGDTPSHLVSIPSLNLKPQLNVKLAAKYPYLVDYFNTVTNIRWHLQYSQNKTVGLYGLQYGTFREYEMKHVFPFLCSLIHEQTADLINCLIEGCSSDFCKLWETALYDTMTRSAKSMYGDEKYFHRLTHDYMNMLKNEMLRSNNYKVDDIYITEIDRIVIKHSCDTNLTLPVGNDLGQFVLRRKDINWVFFADGGFDLKEQRNVHGFLTLPRACLFNDSLIVAIDDYDNKVYVGFNKQQYDIVTFSRISIQCYEEIPSLTEIECNIVFSRIHNRPLTSYVFKDICTALNS